MTVLWRRCCFCCVDAYVRMLQLPIAASASLDAAIVVAIAACCSCCPGAASVATLASCCTEQLLMHCTYCYNSRWCHCFEWQPQQLQNNAATSDPSLPLIRQVVYSFYSSYVCERGDKRAWSGFTTFSKTKSQSSRHQRPGAEQRWKAFIHSTSSIISA